MSAVLYRWDKLTADKPMALLERRRVIGEKAMISEVRLQKGCDIPSHAHENEQFACLLEGKMRFGLGAEGTPEWREGLKMSRMRQSSTANAECGQLDGR